jgi:hypothetical protein
LPGAAAFRVERRVSTPPPLPSPSAAQSDTLDVYVIPLGVDRYELFCERQADEDAPMPDASGGGLWARLIQRFSVMLRAAEDREEGRGATAPDTGWLGRLQARMLAWVAERIAEQRLLWRLRGKAHVVAHHPDDVTFETILPLAHRLLRHDYDRHRRWLVVDVVLLVASGVLALVPGPNVLAYFFAFRVVGHWLSMRGARNGLHVARWRGRSCPPLTRLRGIERLDPQARARCLHAVASELSLERLPRFVERVIRR